jgi:predicted ArsR family transcriptional regulator
MSMRSTLDQDDLAFLRELHRVRAANVQELCGALGVTATAIRQRLLRLQGLGLVDRVLVRAGRGRPHHNYVVTDAGQRELGDNYSELALLLWDELRQIEIPAIRERVLSRMQARMVQRYGRTVDAPTVPQRMEQLRGALVDRGFQAEFEQRGQLPVLREQHCPYHDLAAADSTICELEQKVFEQVLGTPLVLAQCCRNGDMCCEFHAVPVTAEV